MIKILKKKFIRSAMIAVSVLLFVLFLGINVSNIVLTVRQADATIEILSSPKAGMENFDPSEFHHGFLQAPNDNIENASVYFIAYVDKNGAIKDITAHTKTLSADSAKKIAEKVIRSGRKKGYTSGYRYGCYENGEFELIFGEKGIEYEKLSKYVFLDLNRDFYRIIQVLVISILACLFCWGMMLLLVIRLSERTIRPVAENMERQKQFITDAGHEIKTPLAIIQANAEVLELHNGGENKWIGNIKEQVTRLGGLTQNLLTLAKLDENRADSEKTDVDISAVAVETIKMFEQSAMLKNVRIAGNFQSDVILQTDREHIGRIISILLDNAVKYSVENSEIECFVGQQNKVTEIKVVNVCDKLPDCEPERLFDRFYRPDSARTRSDGGYGIGLAAAKAITEIHGGTIRADYLDNNIIVFTVSFK